MGKTYEKQTKTIEDQGQKQVEALKTKAIANKSDDNSSNSKEIYHKIFEETIDEILEMSWEINYNNLVYNFKGPTSSKGFTEFGGPMYTYDQLRKDNSTTTRIRTKKFKSELGQIKLRDREKNGRSK